MKPTSQNEIDFTKKIRTGKKTNGDRLFLILFKIFAKPLKSERGTALLMAIFSTLFLLFIAAQVSNTSISEYLVSAQELKRVQAFYAADACMELSLLRIKLYQQAEAAIGSTLPDPSMLEFIWQFPFAWPLPLPPGLNSVEKGEAQGLLKTSLMKNSWIGQISSEGGKIDVNDLGSPSEFIRKATSAQLMNIFELELKNNPKFSDRYRGFQFQKLINNMADWVDENSESLNGGPEKAFYSGIDSQMVPPNQSFKTLNELHLVADMKDDLFDLLKNRITIYGIKGINPNYATAEVFTSLDPTITPEIADLLIKRRSDPKLGGPYKDEADFTNYLSTAGGRLSTPADQRMALVFEPVSSFKVECFGSVKDVTRKFIAIVFDFDKVKTRLKEYVAKDNPQTGTQTGISPRCQGKQDLLTCECGPNRNDPAFPACQSRVQSGAAGATPATPPNPGPKPGRPNVVFMQES